MSKPGIEVSDNDLSVIMGGALEAARWLGVAATTSHDAARRKHYLEAMHSALIAVEQARQIAGREPIGADDCEDDEPDQ